MDGKNMPWYPAPYEARDVYALKGLQGGTADPGQQARALDWILKNACGTYDLSYRPTSDRDTSFAEGRRFVGLQIIKMLNLDMSVLDKENMRNDNV